MKYFILIILLSILTTSIANTSDAEPKFDSLLIYNNKVVSYAQNFDSISNSRNIFGGCKVKSTLTNNSNDTIYFLSQTCDDISLFKYNTDQFNAMARYLCNASYPDVRFIAPNSTITFETNFRIIKQNSNEIDVSFVLKKLIKEEAIKLMKTDRSENYKDFDSQCDNLNIEIIILSDEPKILSEK
jgi:hypothetical protein